MPFPFGGALGAMGLGQFGRGGQLTIPGHNPGAVANPNDPPPPVPFGFGDDAARQRWQATYDAWQARNGGMDQQQWYKQNPYDPVAHEAQLDQSRPGWRQEFPQQPQRMPPVPGQPTTGPSYDDYVRGGGGIMPPMGQTDPRQIANQVMSQPGHGPQDYAGGTGYGVQWNPQPGAFNPTQMRHNAWVGQHGGMAPLSQYPQFGQGGGWGGFGGALGSAFGLRR